MITYHQNHHHCHHHQFEGHKAAVRRCCGRVWLQMTSEGRSLLIIIITVVLIIIVIAIIIILIVDVAEESGYK